LDTSHAAIVTQQAVWQLGQPKAAKLVRLELF